MQTTPPNSEQNTASPNPHGDTNAFARLASLPATADKNTLISTIDGACMAVLSELSNHESGDLSGDLLLKVQTSLNFLEQCLIFKDDEFTTFAKGRANELQAGLANCLERIKVKDKPTATIDPSPKQTEKQDTPVEVEAPIPASDVATEAKTEQPVEEEKLDPHHFPYDREEKILIDYAFKKICNRLAFMRGDSYKAENSEPVLVSGIHEDGVSPFFLLSPDFPEILEPAFNDLIHEKRDLLSRRVYVHTNKNDSDEDVRTLFEETHYRDIDGIISLGFDAWAGEIAKAGIAGLPQEKKLIGPKKEEETGGIGSSLKKVFSFGSKEKKVKAKKDRIVEDTTAIRIHKEWQSFENKHVFSLSQHFSYSLISYAIQLNEKQFETEYECICQIVNQQDTPDVGPVVTNLSRLYKFYDNIFFDLVILVLFQRKNKFDVNMLQAACMSQNFVVDRLPLCMDELRRRPMEHAKHILAILKDETENHSLKQAITDYFHVHETIHSSKVGKRIQASENLMKRQADKLDENPKKVIEEILHTLGDVNELKAQQEENGTFLGEEILDTIADGIDRAVAHL